MFCAIATTIDRCKTEGVVDVFQVVKALRIHKPGAVLTVVSIVVSLAGIHALSIMLVCVWSSHRISTCVNYRDLKITLPLQRSRFSF